MVYKEVTGLVEETRMNLGGRVALSELCEGRIETTSHKNTIDYWWPRYVTRFTRDYSTTA